MREELIRVENGCFRREDDSTVLKSPFPGGSASGSMWTTILPPATAYLDLFKAAHTWSGDGPFPAAVGWARWNWNAGSCKTPGS